MSDRERWIVYPLIFLALGVALRDKLTRTLNHVELIDGETVQMDLKHGVVAGEATQAQIDFARGMIHAETIRCRNLVVEHDLTAQKIAAQNLATRRVSSNEVVVSAPGGEVRIVLEALPQPDSKLPGSDRAGGRIVVFGAEGKAQVLLSPGEAGGEVSVVDESLRLRLNFGGFRGGVMLAGETGGGARIPFLTLPPGLTPSDATPQRESGETKSESNAPRPPELEEE